MVRKALFTSLALAPATIALHYLVHPPETLEFVLAALSLVPLAWLIGEATEHAAEHTGPGIGGFLNATFGNAPELIIALIAVNEGLTEVVRGSLTRSVIGGTIMMARKEDGKLAVPFGPFLTVSALAYVFFGEKLIRWYLSWGGF